MLIIFCYEYGMRNGMRFYSFTEVYKIFVLLQSFKMTSKLMRKRFFG